MVSHAVFFSVSGKDGGGKALQVFCGPIRLCGGAEQILRKRVWGVLSAGVFPEQRMLGAGPLIRA